MYGNLIGCGRTANRGALREEQHPGLAYRNALVVPGWNGQRQDSIADTGQIDHRRLGFLLLFLAGGLFRVGFVGAALVGLCVLVLRGILIVLVALLALLVLTLLVLTLVILAFLVVAFRGHG